MPMLLVLVTLALYWPATGFGFLNYDDPDFVTSNAHVRGGLSWEALRWAFQLNQGDYWHPLTWLSLMLDASLFGQQAGGFHFTNVAFHAANAVLVFLLLRLLTGALWRSVVVAALFALHPLRVESVAWVTERKDVLSAFFGLLSLLCYVGYAQRKRPNPAAPNTHHAPRTTHHASRPTFHAPGSNRKSSYGWRVQRRSFCAWRWRGNSLVTGKTVKPCSGMGLKSRKTTTSPTTTWPTRCSRKAESTRRSPCTSKTSG
jgi:hypothetical protein